VQKQRANTAGSNGEATHRNGLKLLKMNTKRRTSKQPEECTSRPNK